MSLATLSFIYTIWHRGNALFEVTLQVEAVDTSQDDWSFFPRHSNKYHVFQFQEDEEKKWKTSTNNSVQTSFWSTFLNGSTRRNEMMFMVIGNLLMRVRGHEDIEVLPVALLREVIRLTGQDRDEGSTKSHVERCVDYLDPPEKTSLIQSCQQKKVLPSTYRIQVGRDVSKPTGKIQQRCLYPTGSTDSRENIQYREWKPCHEKNEEDNTQHFHRSSFTGRFCATFESMDCFFHQRTMKKWTLIRGRRGDRRVWWNPKWTTERRLISSPRWLVIRCLPRSSKEDSHEIIAHRLISGISDASVDIPFACRELSLVQSTFLHSKTPMEFDQSPLLISAIWLDRYLRPWMILALFVLAFLRRRWGL